MTMYLMDPSKDSRWLGRVSGTVRRSPREVILLVPHSSYPYLDLNIGSIRNSKILSSTKYLDLGRPTLMKANANQAPLSLSRLQQ
jgi:hypothetical protein